MKTGIHYNCFMNVRGRLIALIIVILALVTGLVFWLQTPRLLEATPPNGAVNVSAGEPLRLVFSNAMDPDSVVSRLRIEPAQTGKSAWQGNTLIYTPDQPWQNSTTYQIRLAKGARSSNWLNLTISQEKSWSFTIEDPLLAYLYPSDAPAQIYTINPLTGESKQITDLSGEVLDFSVSSNGVMLYYSLNLGGKGSAIYRLDRASGKSILLLDCPQALCRYPQVSPQNDFLAYERTPLTQKELTNKPQVWIAALPSSLFTDKNNTTPSLTLKPVGDPQHQTQQPLWSPGGLLAYYDDTLSAFIIQNSLGDKLNRFPSQTGQPGDWDTSGESFIFPEFITAPQTSATLSELNPIPASHLLRHSLKGETITDLTIMDYLEDNAPAFSPDGKWLVFARKYLDIARWTPGRQLWIMSLEKGDAYAITTEPQYNHYDFAWNPDSKQIAYVRFNQTILTEPPEIWLTKLDGSGQQLLVRNGYSPQWIP